MKKYISELLGTFALALTVEMSLSGKFPVPMPVVAALTLGVCVYTMGAISGTHINPAITLGVLAVRKISVKDALAYLVAQFGGAALTIPVFRALVATRPAVAAVDSLDVFKAEMLGAFWLAFGVAAVVHGKVPAPAAGLTIGGSLLLGITMAASGSNAVLNPAVALGIHSFSLTYLLGPIAGSVLAMLLYRFLSAGSEA